MDQKHLLLQKYERLAEIERLQKGLPHLHGWKWYPWARSYFESSNKMCLLVAANQISKSSTNIRKCIHWATETDLWPSLWSTVPRQFWYLYPSKGVATVEWKTKWLPEFMPRAEFKDDPKYGWKETWAQGKIESIEFFSGVIVFFKSYEQDVHQLQTGTVAAIFCDEELPVDLYDELKSRLTATDGYFHMVFTATRGQEFWKNAMEDVGKETERFPDAWKRCVSLYDCLQYDDGSDSPWTLDRIERRKADCKNEKEVLKRVMGRFVKDDDLKYESFSRTSNVKKPNPRAVPKDWHIYSGVDIGSGGQSGHPSAICFVAVRPDYKKARVFRVWRGDGIKTTSGDVVLHYQVMKSDLPHIVAQHYDHGAKDFQTIAERNGETFFPAEKSHEIGEDTLNTLFAHQMLDLDEDTPEIEKLIYELSSISKTENKRHAKDDLVDALRYCVTKIPFDWAGIKPAVPPPPKKQKTEIDLRREFVVGDGFLKSQEEVEREFEEWNNYLES